MTAMDHPAVDPHPPASTPHRLMIADDEPLVVSVLEAQLRLEFEIVGCATDAAQAIEMATLHQPAVAIIDVQMPAGGGLHATREIREHSPGTAIVALSADETGPMVLAMLDAGAMAYVRKGLTGSELADILRSAITAHARLH